MSSNTSIFGVASVLLSSLTHALAVTKQNAPTVTLRNGSYRGVHFSEYNQDLFLGIPFAQPPLGELRFKPPVSLNKTWTGIRDATSYGPFCPGYTNEHQYEQNEDCLSINVIRPVGCENESLPIAAWIYGGGFYSGGSGDLKYNLSWIVAESVRMNKPVIGVSLNYRVAGWGFMRSKELVAEGSTNMGLRDQRLALHWIQENIAAFGGDASKVTVFGESAGAYSIGYHLIAYGGRDDKLFRAAISESGNSLSLRTYSWSKCQTYYDNITALTGCGNITDTLACLRKVPYNTLNQVFNSTFQKLFFPQPDNDFIRSTTYKQLQSGQFVKVPWLNGANTDEGTIFVPTPINTDEELAAYIHSQGPDNATVSKILELYPDDPATDIPSSVTERPNSTTYGLQYKRASAYDGDYYFIAGRRLSNIVWASHNTTTYSYRFNTVRYTGGPDFKGVTHGTEIPFVFHNLNGRGYNVNPFKDMPKNYTGLSTLMTRMWISFVVTGDDPNQHGLEGVPVWPKYAVDDGTNFVFDANTSSYVEPDTFRKEGIAYLQTVMESQYGY